MWLHEFHQLSGLTQKRIIQQKVHVMKKSTKSPGTVGWLSVLPIYWKFSFVPGAFAQFSFSLPYSENQQGRIWNIHLHQKCIAFSSKSIRNISPPASFDKEYLPTCVLARSRIFTFASKKKRQTTSWFLFSFSIWDKVWVMLPPPPPAN